MATHPSDSALIPLIDAHVMRQARQQGQQERELSLLPQSVRNASKQAVAAMGAARRLARRADAPLLEVAMNGFADRVVAAAAPEGAIALLTADLVSRYRMAHAASKDELLLACMRVTLEGTMFRFLRIVNSQSTQNGTLRDVFSFCFKTARAVRRPEVVQLTVKASRDRGEMPVTMEWAFDVHVTFRGWSPGVRREFVGQMVRVFEIAFQTRRDSMPPSVETMVDLWTRSAYRFAETEAPPPDAHSGERDHILRFVRLMTRVVTCVVHIGHENQALLDEL